MALSIVSNPTALTASSQVNKANNLLSNSIKQLSTGLRINSASDDASGLAVSEKLRGQITGLSKAATNAQDAISLLQTAESAMGSMTDVLQRMRELAVQAGNPAYTTNDRAVLQLELDQLKDEIDRISDTTEFNTKKLLNGDAAAVWSSSSGDIEAIVNGAVMEGDYKLTYDITPGDNAIYKTNIMAVKEGSLSYRMTANATSITELKNFEDMTRSEDVLTLAVSSTANASLTYIGGSIASVAATFGATTATITVTSAGGSIYMELEMLSDRSAAGSAQIRFRLTDAETGEQTDWLESSVNSAGAIVNMAGLTTGLLGVATTASTLGGTGQILAAGATVSEGDKVLFNVAAASTVAAAAGSTGNVVTISGMGTFTMTAYASATTELTHTLYTAQIDDAGNVSYGNFDIVVAKGVVTAAGSATADVQFLAGGDTASENTLLRDLAGFVASDGRNVLDNTQEITLYGNGQNVKVVLEGSDTIADLEAKLTAALIEGLGVGADTTNSNAYTVNSNLVNFVNGTAAVTANSPEAIGGTFVIQTALLGENSDIQFVGDQNVLNALGVSQVQASSDSQLNVRVNNAQTGAYIGEDTITDNVLRGLIDNVEVVINPVSAADVTFNDTTKTMEFTSKGTATEAYLHLTDTATQATIGANESQTLDISIGRLDVLSLGLSNVSVESFDSAQGAITKIDMAIEQLSQTRAISGSQINRLDYTISNLDVARENLTASESRIRDLDMATATTELAARQVLLQSASAMLAQANQLPSYAAQLLG